MPRGAVLHAVLYTLALAGLSSLWLVVMTASGWYRDPDRMELGIAVPVLTVLVLVFACRHLRNDGCTIGSRLALCVAIVIFGAVLASGFAYVYTSSRDGYFTHLQQAHAEGLRRAHRPDAEIATMLANHPLATARGFAINRLRNTIVFGMIGTIAGLLLFRGRRTA